jgi:hypothetical protein
MRGSDRCKALMGWLAMPTLHLAFGGAVEVMIMLSGPIGWGFNGTGEGFEDIPGIAGGCHVLLSQGFDKF